MNKNIEFLNDVVTKVLHTRLGTELTVDELIDILASVSTITTDLASLDIEVYGAAVENAVCKYDDAMFESLMFCANQKTIDCSNSMKIIGTEITKTTGDFIIISPVVLAVLQSTPTSTFKGSDGKSDPIVASTPLVGHLDNVPVYAYMFTTDPIAIIGTNGNLTTTLLKFEHLSFLNVLS